MVLGGLKITTSSFFPEFVAENTWVLLFEGILDEKQGHPDWFYHSFLSLVYSFLIILEQKEDWKEGVGKWMLEDWKITEEPPLLLNIFLSFYILNSI